MLFSLLLGSALIILPAIVLVFCFIKTPTNLKGYYGNMFCTIAGIAIVAGIVLVVASFF